MTVRAMLSGAAFLIATVASAGADATTFGGSSALAVASLVANASPSIGAAPKRELARLFDGDSEAAWTAGPIVVSASKIVCRSSNVDITARSCALTFGATTRSIAGRLANEMTASLAQAGIQAQGAAGTVYVGAAPISCRVTPAVIRARSGGGASCSYANM